MGGSIPEMRPRWRYTPSVTPHEGRADPYDAHSTRQHYLRICKLLRHIHDPALIKYNLMLFVRENLSAFLPSQWPVGSGVQIGFADMFEENSKTLNICNLDVLKNFSWVFFIGKFIEFFGDGYGNDWYIDDVNVLITSNKSVFCYVSSARMLYFISDCMESVVAEGFRKVWVFYERRPARSLRSDELYFGHRLDAEKLMFLRDRNTAKSILQYLKHQDVTFDNVNDCHSITLSSRVRMRSLDAIPSCVLNELRKISFEPIGQMSFCHRFVFLDTITSEVFVLLSGNRLFKMAASLLGFLRVRHAPLIEATPNCWSVQNGYYRRLHVAEKLAFACNTPYSLPGDDTLIALWKERGVYNGASLT